MSRFYVAELEGFLRMPAGQGNQPQGLTCSVLDRAYCHRVVWTDRTEVHSRRLRGRERLRADAAARCAELNAEDAL